MKNMIDYIENMGHYTFEEKPFNEVDSLVLSKLAYLDFGVIEGENHGVCKSISTLPPSNQFEQFFADVSNNKATKALYFAVIGAERYNNIDFTDYVNKINIETQSQFSAITFLLDKDTTYVAFRGTDNTLVGWKEDFNMSFLDCIPAQLESAKYLSQIGEKFQGTLIVGGHSKGGNLAVFSATHCIPMVQGRIQKVYNHDGPGFTSDFLASEQFKRIADRVETTLPKSSAVGMFLQQHETYTTIDSSSFTVFQHDPFTWCVTDDHFDYLYDIDEGSAAFRKVVSEWLTKIDEEKRKKFVDTLYEIVTTTNAQTFRELRSSWQKNVITILSTAKDLDDDTSSFLRDTVAAMIKLGINATASLPKINPKCFYCGKKMEYSKQPGKQMTFYCANCDKTFAELE
ncbi:MAG: Mbeg1-like protein [Anaerovoracaceae bacterium]